VFLAEPISSHNIALVKEAQQEKRVWHDRREGDLKSQLLTLAHSGNAQCRRRKKGKRVDEQTHIKNKRASECERLAPNIMLWGYERERAIR